MIAIALFQPDIPQNVGATMRLCACLGLHLDIIEPCGFPWNDKKIKQTGMDYTGMVSLTRHSSWKSFQDVNKDRRIILMTTKAVLPYTDFAFQDGDILLAGQESVGAPDEIHNSVDGRVTIQMQGDARSLNIVNATSMIAGEAIRQVGLKA